MNHSRILLSVAFFTVSPLTVFTQGTPAVPPGGERSGAVHVSELKHFDLDFPGGTPGDLAEAISKATGMHLNLIVPTAHPSTQIMPIKVVDVTVPELFVAIQTASQREVPVVIGVNNPGQARNIQFRTVGVTFQTMSQPVTDESVWSFTSSARTKEDEAILAAGDPSEQVCEYFQLAPYLHGRSVEDITTAIQTGWKMLKADPLPQLSFHEETKLLIAVGVPQYIAQIPQVLQQLRGDDSSPVETIAKWQEELGEIEAKKEGDWTQKAQRIRDQIEQLAKLQKARETIENAPNPGPQRNLQRPRPISR